MARTTPKVVQTTLSFNEGSDTRTIIVGTEAWFAWLTTAHIFAYYDNGVTFTARRQQRRNHWYWYAYAKCNGRLRCHYLGRAADLTPERLGSILKKLRSQPAASRLVQRRKPGAVQSVQAQHDLAQLYSTSADPTAPRLALDRVRQHLDQLAHCFAQRRQLGAIVGQQLLDLAEELVAVLEIERAQADQELTIMRQLLQEAQTHSIQQRGMATWMSGRGEVF